MDKNLIVDEEIRIDKFLAGKLNQPRNQIEQLIKKGFVEIVGKKVTKSSYKLKLNQLIYINFPNIELEKENFNINFDIDIVYEDEYILVIDKPSGVVVHGAPSVKEATVVDWLKSKNISLSTISGDVRHGIVHRLDKGTSGLMVIAKTNKAHLELSKQLEDKSMGRYYLAIIDKPLKDDVIIDKPIGRDRRNRLKMGVVNGGKSAKSSFLKIDTSSDEKYELIAAKLFTGRTHQIRVHLNSINRYILGDFLYGFKGKDDIFNRVFLHAYILYLVHPITKQNIIFKSKIHSQMKQFLEQNFNIKDIYESVNEDNIVSLFNSFS